MKFVVFLVLIVYLSGVSSAPYDSEYAIDENLRAENDALSTESSATTDSTNSDDIAPGEDDPTNSLIPKIRKKIAANDGGKSPSGPGADSATDVEAPEGVDAPAAADQADPGAPADPGAAADPGAPVDKDTEQNGGAGSSVDTAASTEGQGGLGHAAPERVQVHGAAGGEHHSEPESTGANIAVTGNNRQQNTRAGSLQRLRDRLKGSLSFINPNSRVRAQGHGEVTAGANVANFETFPGQSDQPHGHDRAPDHGDRIALRGVGGISAGTPGDSGGSLSDWTSQSGSSLCSGGTNCGDNADVVGAMPVSPAIKRLISCPTCVIFPQGGKNFNPFSFQGIMDQVNRKNQWMRENIILPFFSWGRPLFTKFVPQEQNWN